MKKIVGLIASLFFLLGVSIMPAQAQTQPVAFTTNYGGVDKVTYCYMDPVYSPFISKHDDKWDVEGQAWVNCSPYPLDKMTIWVQLQKKNWRGIYDDVGTKTWYECGYVGEGNCPYGHLTTDWAYCNGSQGDGVWRTRAYMEGWGPQDDPNQTYNHIGPKVSNAKVIDCR